ncbi:MAG TPA: TetR/AcrR family transcriptional regulator [Acidimicrobiales bacterium]
MGRIAGVTADDTRERLLATAADVFGRLGYDGASIAQITAAAGLSSGAIYAHYPSKAELFVATLRAHAEGEFERLLGGDSTGDFVTFLTSRGEALERRTPRESSLLIEAVVAARRHPEVARVLTAALTHREHQLVQLLSAAQAIGEADPTLSAPAVVRFAFMAALGSLVVSALRLPPVDGGEWSAVIARLVDNIRVP